MPVVEAIHVYPVKSCRAVAVDRTRVDRTGLAGDRLFQVVDATGEPITQRTHPRLALVQPVPLDDGVRLEADGMAPLRVRTPDRNDTVVQSLLVTAASYEWLARRAQEPFGPDRFRPNLTIGGTEPWAEDTWRRLAIGGTRFTGALAWPRCSIPQIDQWTAERHREPARVLRRHRWCIEAADDTSSRP